MTVEIKICGLKTKEAVKAAAEAGADYFGCVFYEKSPRHISPIDADEITKGMKGKKVAVLVDADDDYISDVIGGFNPDYLQLHGEEGVDRVNDIKNKFATKIVKALKIRSADDVAAAAKYAEVADMLLFDARPWDNMPSALPGGNGVSFDWQLLKGREFSIPWMLSGGLSEANIEEAIDVTSAKMVDVSSSLEIEPGMKDLELIKKFIEKVRST